MPFGLCTAPFIFQELTSFMCHLMRTRFRIRCCNYLDDLSLMNVLKSGLSRDVACTVPMLESFGWLVSEEKSILIPSDVLIYLGIEWWPRKDLCRMPDSSVISIRARIDAILSSPSVTLQQLQSVFGSLNFAAFAVRSGRLRMRNLQLFLPHCSNDYTVQLPSDCLEDLAWWRIRCASSRRLFIHHPEHFIATDASDIGWGAVVNDTRISGSWSASQTSLHINAKELLAVVFAVTQFQDILADSIVSVQLDNSTARSYLAREGGRMPDLLAITIPFLSMCADFDIYLQPYYLPGRYNTIADDLSRFRLESEWFLAPIALQFLSAHFPTITLDLFASDSAHVCSRYVSRDATDYNSLFVNAYSQTWQFSYEVVLVFPPPSELPRVYNELDCASGLFILVAPAFPSAHWAPLFSHLASASFDLPFDSVLEGHTRRPPSGHLDMDWTAYLIRR